MAGFIPRVAEVLALLLWASLVLLLGIVAVQLVLGRIGDVPLVGALLNRPQLLDRLIPTLILCLAAWVVCEISIRASAVRRELRGASMFAGAVASGGRVPRDLPSGTRAAARSERMSTNRLVRAALHESLPAAAALDASALTGRYTTLQIWTWLFPVMGFLGTALGLASAIGGFSDALRETTRIEVLVARLSQLVIPNLADAFETTVLALAISLISYTCTSVLQAADWRALERLDEATLRLLDRSPRSGGGSENDERVVERLDAIVVLLRSVSGLGETFKGAAEDFRVAAKEIKEAAREQKAAAAELRASARLPYHVTITRGDTP